MIEHLFKHRTYSIVQEAYLKRMNGKTISPGVLAFFFGKLNHLGTYPVGRKIYEQCLGPWLAHGWYTEDAVSLTGLLVLVLWILDQIILYCGCCLCHRKMNSTVASIHCRSVESSVGHNIQHCRFCRFLQNQPLVNWYMWTSAIESTWQIHGWIPQPPFFCTSEYKWICQRTY